MRGKGQTEWLRCQPVWEPTPTRLWLAAHRVPVTDTEKASVSPGVWGSWHWEPPMGFGRHPCLCRVLSRSGTLRAGLMTIGTGCLQTPCKAHATEQSERTQPL